MYEKYGKLYIVATPLGNMEDITLRALRVLKEVDLIACEDTRESIKILNHYDIKNNLVSYHKYNEKEKSDFLINELKSGKNIALITDQGTPLISDPGFVLIEKLAKESIEITSIPGACALINALVLSGLATDEFTFVGFLPFKKKERKEKLEKLSKEKRTLVFYISPHKILNDMEDLIESFGDDRRACLLREMTKKFEEINRDTLKNIYDTYKNREIKGEFVLVIRGNEKDIMEDFKDMTLDEHYQYLITTGLNEKEALKTLSKLRNINKKELYKILKVK